MIAHLCTCSRFLQQCSVPTHGSCQVAPPCYLTRALPPAVPPSPPPLPPTAGEFLNPCSPLGSHAHIPECRAPLTVCSAQGTLMRSRKRRRGSLSMQPPQLPQGSVHPRHPTGCPYPPSLPDGLRHCKVKHQGQELSPPPWAVSWLSPAMLAPLPQGRWTVIFWLLIKSSFPLHTH